MADPSLRTFEQQQAALRAKALAAPDDYSIYFINNIVLNRDDYDIHARKVWDAMSHDRNLQSNDAINQYLTEYSRLFKAENGNRPLDPNVRIEIGNRLTTQISKLIEIEKAVQGIKPTADQIADSFIEGHVKSVDGLSAGQVKDVRDAIIEYESTEITPDSAVNIMKESWAKNGVPSNKINDVVDPDTGEVLRKGYATLLEERMDHYRSSTGGNFDPVTASARAAVDIRALIDRERGVPDKMIVDENNTMYQDDIFQMGNWMRTQAYIDKKIDDAAANGQTIDARQAMRPLDNFGYNVYRRSTVEIATQTAYRQAQNAPAPATTSAAHAPTPAPAPHAPAPATGPADGPAIPPSPALPSVPETANTILEGISHIHAQIAEAHYDIGLTKTGMDAKVYDRFDNMESAIENAATDPAEALQSTYNYVTATAAGLQTELKHLVQKHWDTMEPYFAGMGIDTSPGNPVATAKALLDNKAAIDRATTGWDGAEMRTILQNREFDRIASPLEKLHAAQQSIETLAEENGITLSSAAPPSATADLNRAAQTDTPALTTPSADNAPTRTPNSPENYSPQ